MTERAGGKSIRLDFKRGGEDAAESVVGRPHTGIVGALNAGIECCSGRFVARMDADDRMSPERLQLQAQALQAEPELCAVGTHVRLFPRAGLGRGLRAYEAWLNSLTCPEQVEQDAFVECPIAHPTLMIRRAALARLGYRDRGWPEDYDLLLRLLAQRERLGIVPRVLLQWRNHPKRATRTRPEYAQARFVECKAAFLANGILHGRKAYVLWGYGGTGRALCRALTFHNKHPILIIDLHPRRIGQRIGGAQVVPPSDLAQRVDHPIVASVAGLEARCQIRHALTGWGYQEGVDFVVAA